MVSEMVPWWWNNWYFSTKYRKNASDVKKMRNSDQNEIKTWGYVRQVFANSNWADQDESILLFLRNGYPAVRNSLYKMWFLRNLYYLNFVQRSSLRNLTCKLLVHNSKAIVPRIVSRIKIFSNANLVEL